MNLEDLLGGIGGTQGRRFVQNVEGELQVTLEEAYGGSDEVINVDGKRLSLRVPAGTRDGSRLRLAGQAPGAATCCSPSGCSKTPASTSTATT